MSTPKSTRRIWHVAIVLIATIASAQAAPPSAEPSPDAGPKHGAEFNKALEQHIDLEWGGALTLRAALAGLSRSQGIAIFLDRRVDPGQSVELAISDATLSDALKQIAAKLNLGTTQLGPVIYFGPQQSATQLRTLAGLARQQAETATTARRAALLRPAPTEWQDLATPHELMSKVAQDAGITITNADDVPHDLWAGLALPPLSPVDRLTLLSIGFDLHPVVDRGGSSVKLQPIAEPVRLERVFQVGSNARQVAEKLRRALENATIEVRGQKIAVLGRAEDHDVVEQALLGKSFQVTKPTKSTAAEGVKVFSLRIDNQPIGPLLKQLAAKLQLELQMDPAELDEAGIKQSTLVSFAVEKATLDDLLKAAVTPAGLIYRLEGKSLIVTPAKKMP